MIPFKLLLGSITVFLTIIAYIPYIKSIFDGKTKPHSYSWFVWSINTLVVALLQLSHGAGAGAFMTVTVEVMSLFIFVVSLTKYGNRDITRLDALFAFLALTALVLWLFVKQPLASTILILMVDIAAFVPTVRESWKNPYSEILTFYLINVFRFIITLFALESYSILTALYPSMWLLVNALFSLMLVTRRKSLLRRNH